MTTVDLRYPFAGRWLVRNSPANRVPSHGTTEFASSYAIDFVPVDDTGRSAPYTFRSFLRTESAATFVGFGRAVQAPTAGVVVACHDSEPDHQSYRGLPSVGYAATQRRRAAVGWLGLAGNHVLIQTGDVVIAVCHLQQSSLAVEIGQQVDGGELLGRCGNSGNSTEPHVHLQAMNSLDVRRADAVPLTFEGALPRNGEIVDAR